MKSVVRPILSIAIILFIIETCAAAPPALPAAPATTMAFVVSMEQPSTHRFHVVLRCDGLEGETQDFKMPVWSPGYYVIMDYPKNVLNFRAADDAGRALAWEKASKNVWSVKSRGAAAVTVSYDVYAFRLFCAESYLDDRQAFIHPPSVFMHLAGRIAHPVTVTVEPAPGWSTISTGLERVEGEPRTFFAPDFDVLYDSPILVGNQRILTFYARGVPHELVGAELAAIDSAKVVSDLARMVESSADLIGEIPYRRYVFMHIGRGGGGLEHANSTAIAFDPAELDSAAGYRD